MLSSVRKSWTERCKNTCHRQAYHAGIRSVRKNPRRAQPVNYAAVPIQPDGDSDSALDIASAPAKKQSGVFSTAKSR